LQCHLGSFPKERDGISIMALSFPEMCSGVSGNAHFFFIRRASARSSYSATHELFDAKRCTQFTVGWLLLNNAT